MWWVLACTEPDPRLDELSSDHGQLQTEMGVLGEQVGKTTTRMGELETQVDRRLAEVEARVEQLRKDLDQRSLQGQSAQARSNWVGRWEVKAIPVTNHGCSNDLEANSFTWNVEAAEGRDALEVAIEGNTRFRSHKGTLASGVFSAVQTDGFDSSLITATPVVGGFEGYRVLTRIEYSRPCTMVWKLVGKRG